MGEARNFDSSKIFEIFLLLMVKCGDETTYDLVSNMALSVSATSPALRHMKEDGLLSGVEGPRSRVRYALTKEGEEYLRWGLDCCRSKDWFIGQHRLFNSLPRVVLLAWLSSPDADSAIQYIRKAQKRIQRGLAMIESEIEHLKNVMASLKKELASPEYKSHPESGEIIRTAYKLLMKTSGASQARMQIAALEAFLPLLAEFPPAKTVFGDLALGGADIIVPNESE
jgi:DNA-binding PadR family transcriptional regulator